MLNIKYAFNSLKEKKLFTILTIIQLIVSFTCLYGSLYYYNEEKTKSDKILSLIGNKDIYYFKDMNESLWNYSSNKNKDRVKLEDFVGYMEDSKDFNFIYNNAYNVSLKTFPGSNNIIRSDFSKVENNTNFIDVNSLILNYDYNKLFPLLVDSGRYFEAKDFNLDYAKDTLPVLLGSKFKKYFSLGDETQIMYGSKIITTIKVIGFLKDDQYYIGNDSSMEGIKYLSNYIIIPKFKMAKELSTNDDTLYADYRFYLSSNLYGSTLVINNQNLTNKQNILNDLNKRLQEIGLSVKCAPLSEEFENSVALYKNIRNIFTGLFIIIFVFCTIGIVSNFLYTISRKNKEFAVHLLSGASNKDIAIRILLEVSMLITLSTILSMDLISIFGKLLNINFNNSSAIKLIILNSLLIIIISIIPMNKVRKLELSLLMKED
jgi:putative ABC transport system permease protein